ncbi:pyruvate kinase [bacterium DOLZORAL124_38_8]|nr:MAG: pyruvate kinase [bacterium DOLZORAL124_38_8]
MRKTKIVATIGPATHSLEQLDALAKAGVGMYRLNFSHGSYDWYEGLIKDIRSLKNGNPIILDTKGPEIRSGELESPRTFEPGDSLVLSVADGITKSDEKISVSYKKFITDVEVDDLILVDGGVMSMRILEKKGEDIICEIVDGGTMSSRRHLNVRGRTASLDPVTEKDWEDLKFGIQHGVDMIAQSFVRSASDVKLIKDFLAENNAGDIQVIAKIETCEAAQNIEEILTVADGIMVARGDLGAELPFTQVPRVQQELIEAAEKAQKPVIVATQMLETMMENPIPTRAEVTDVSLAVFQRADATMLSGETAAGKYPIKVVETMSEILLESESSFVESSDLRNIPTNAVPNGLAKSVATLSQTLEDIDVIFVLTHTGETARDIASFRPKADIFAFTDSEITARQLGVLWGTTANVIDFDGQNPENTVQTARELFLKKFPEKKGKQFILLSGSLVNGEFVRSVQVRDL